MVVDMSGNNIQILVCDGNAMGVKDDTWAIIAGKEI